MSVLCRTLASCLVILAGFYGCAPMNPPPPSTPDYVPTFKFSVKEVAKPNSADVTLALVKAEYGTNLRFEPWQKVEYFQKFAENMGLDFQEGLAAKGFSTLGPFPSVMEMTHPDKKNSDLVLTPVLEITVTTANLESVYHSPGFAGAVLGDNGGYTTKGDLVFGGRVTLALTESLSTERMWFKSVDIGQISEPFQGTTNWVNGNKQIDWGNISDDPDKGLVQAAGKGLEKVYDTVLATAMKYLDPEELRGVKKSAEEIRSKKVY